VFGTSDSKATLFSGCTAVPNRSFYIGFKAQETGEPTLSLYIERSLFGTRKDVKVPRELKRNYRFGESDKTHCWFHFEQRG